MVHACSVTWKNAGRKYTAHGLFRHVIDAVLWVLTTAPGSTAIVARPLRGTPGKTP